MSSLDRVLTEIDITVCTWQNAVQRLRRLRLDKHDIMGRCGAEAYVTNLIIVLVELADT